VAGLLPARAEQLDTLKPKWVVNDTTLWVAVSPDDKLILSQSLPVDLIGDDKNYSSFFRIYNSEDCSLIGRYKTDEVYPCIHFSPDSKSFYFYNGRLPQSIIKKDVATGKEETLDVRFMMNYFPNFFYFTPTQNPDEFIWVGIGKFSINNPGEIAVCRISISQKKILSQIGMDYGSYENCWNSRDYRYMAVAAKESDGHSLKSRGYIIDTDSMTVKYKTNENETIYNCYYSNDLQYAVYTIKSGYLDTWVYDIKNNDKYKYSEGYLGYFSNNNHFLHLFVDDVNYLNTRIYDIIDFDKKELVKRFIATSQQPQTNIFISDKKKWIIGKTGQYEISCIAFPPCDIRESARTSEIKILPNPASSELSIEWVAENSGIFKIDISDSRGLIVKTIANIQADTGINTTQLNTKGLAPGAYFLTITGLGNKQILTTKLIIQK